MAKSSFNKCVGKKLKGKHFRTKKSQKAAFKKATRACKKKKR